MPLRLLLGNLRGSLPGGNCDTVVLFCVVCVRVPLLWVVRHATQAEPSGLGVSVGGILDWQSSSVRCEVASLLDDWGLPWRSLGNS